MKLACQNCRPEVNGMHEYGILKVHMPMLPEETEVGEDLEADEKTGSPAESWIRLEKSPVKS